MYLFFSVSVNIWTSEKCSCIAKYMLLWSWSENGFLGYAAMVWSDSHLVMWDLNCIIKQTLWLSCKVPCQNCQAAATSVKLQQVEPRFVTVYATIAVLSRLHTDDRKRETQNRKHVFRVFWHRCALDGDRRQHFAKQGFVKRTLLVWQNKCLAKQVFCCFCFRPVHMGVSLREHEMCFCSFPSHMRSALICWCL